MMQGNLVLLNPHREEDYELLSRMEFKNGDVLEATRDKIMRNAHLLKAAVLDSLNKEEVILTLEDKNSSKKLKSRIIATGDDRVLLERGLTIPVHCILQVEFPS